MNEDAISRQAVKDWFCTNYCSEHNKCEHFEKGDCNSMNELYSMPSVHVKTKIGHWIMIDEELQRYKCSECGEIIRVYDNETLKENYRFSHCGAKMEESKG